MKNQRLPDWETHLVLRAQDGEEVAFELLVDEHRPLMMRLAMRLLRNVDDANDAVQDAMLKGFRAIRFFEAGRPVRPWLMRICSNCCVDEIRRRKGVGENLDWHENTLSDGGQTVQAEAEERVRRDVIRQAFSRLPMRYREIMVMRHFRNMEVGEIAVALNKPEGTIKSWLFRARALLKKDLQLALSAA